MYKSAYYTALALGAIASKEEIWFDDEHSSRTGFDHQFQSDRQLNELFEKVVAMPADKRIAYLDQHCSDNLELKFKIIELLKGADTLPPEDFLNPGHLLSMIKDIL